jgi:uncharacterized protein YkwD
MRVLGIFLSLSFPILCGLVSQPAHGSETATHGADFRSAVETETFSIVNEYRQANDLPLLIWDAKIAKEARRHSQDMATGDVDFGHDGFRDRVDRLKNVMSGFRGAGENVLMTDDLDHVARKAVTLWLHSPHHLKNIRGDYNYSAVGIWEGKDGALYFTQVFLKFEPQQEEADAAASSSSVMPFGMLAPASTRARP